MQNRSSPNSSQFYYISWVFLCFPPPEANNILNYVWPKKVSLLSSYPLSQSVCPYMCICVSHTVCLIYYFPCTQTHTHQIVNFVMKKKSQSKLGPVLCHSQRQNGSRGAMATIREVKAVSTADSPSQLELQRLLSLIVSWLVLGVLKIFREKRKKTLLPNS